MWFLFENIINCQCSASYLLKEHICHNGPVIYTDSRTAVVVKLYVLLRKLEPPHAEITFRFLMNRRLQLLSSYDFGDEKIIVWISHWGRCSKTCLLLRVQTQSFLGSHISLTERHGKLDWGSLKLTHHLSCGRRSCIFRGQRQVHLSRLEHLVCTKQGRQG